MEKKKPGDTVKFKIERDGEIREQLITLSEPKSFQPIGPPR
jgi:S1-C subfamily serine protease